MDNRGHQGHPPPGVDATVPSPARIYDYLLGGKDNFAADRAAAEEIAETLPDVCEGIRANRAFLGRAVRFLAERGIDQFIDVGTGLPTAGNVHEVAHSVNPEARVVYVDNDPVVLAHGRALLADNATTTVISGDLRDPAAILKHPDTLALIDFDRPVAVLFVAVLHFVDDFDDPHGLVAAYREAVAPGSYIAISHTEERPSTVKAAQVYQRASAQATVRPRDQIAALFDKLDLVPPGLVPASQWRPDDLTRVITDDVWILAGVGRKH